MSTARRHNARRATALAWCGVVLAALLEVAWPLALAGASGPARPGWAVVGLALALVSLAVLALALRTLPLGSAYAVWVGLGTVGVAAAGVAWLGEPLTPPRALCLAAIVAGVVGLTLTDTPRSPADRPGPSTGAAGGDLTRPHGP